MVLVSSCRVLASADLGGVGATAANPPAAVAPPPRRWIPSRTGVLFEPDRYPPRGMGWQRVDPRPGSGLVWPPPPQRGTASRCTSVVDPPSTHRDLDASPGSGAPRVGLPVLASPVAAQNT